MRPLLKLAPRSAVKCGDLFMLRRRLVEDLSVGISLKCNALIKIKIKSISDP